jgi:acetyl esterase/lipase
LEPTDLDVDRGRGSPAKSFQELLSAVPLDARGDLTVLRPVFEEFMLQTPLPSDVSLTDRTLGGVPVLEISVPEAIADATLLYFHGGVFALGPARASAGLACLLARQARAKVLSVDYRLAPEHPYPAATDDAFGSCRGLLETGIRPERIGLFGESAGGALALGALVARRDAGLAPLLIQCGSNEVVLDDATRLAAAAATADVAVQLHVTLGVPHVFQASAPELDEATAALARTGAFLQAHLQLAE